MVGSSLSFLGRSKMDGCLHRGGRRTEEEEEEAAYSLMRAHTHTLSSSRFAYLIREKVARKRGGPPRERTLCFKK